MSISPELRKERANQVADLIMSDGRPFKMEDCCACIMPRVANAMGFDDPTHVSVAQEAEWLGLERKSDYYAHGDGLFWGFTGHPDHRLADGQAPWEATREQAAAVVRHFGETGEIDWSRV